MFYKSEKLAVFIEHQSMIRALKASDIRIDYNRMRKFFMSSGRLLRMSFYIATDTAPISSTRKLTDYLDYNGYTVVSRGVDDEASEAATRRATDILCMSMAMDMTTLIDHVDHFVLVSGSHIMTPMVARLQRGGARVSVMSTTQNADRTIIDNDLRRQADTFLDISDYAEEISRQEERLSA